MPSYIETIAVVLFLAYFVTLVLHVLTLLLQERRDRR